MARLRPRANAESPRLWRRLSGRIGEAVDLYQDLASAYTRFPHVHFKLGFLFLTLQDYESAARHFSTEIERYAAGSEGDQSEQSPRKPLPKHGAVQEKTFLFCARVGRSEAYAALKDGAKAENDLLFVANRGGSTKHILVAMGVLFSRFGMHLRAESCLEKCAAVDAEDPDYLIAHAELRLAQKRFANAARMFEKCRMTCSSSSVAYHRALIGEGAALMHQNKYQEAVVLLLQAMNNLQACIRNIRESISGGGSLKAGINSVTQRSDSLSKDEELLEYLQLYHQATNLYAGLCLLKGELKAALDTYYSIIQHSTASLPPEPLPSEAEKFQLPTLCVMPGTRDHQGDLVDSTKLSTKNLSEVVRHLDEIELRYGPDPCVYFHRANAHKALGEFEHFVHDLSLVESMNPEFLDAYIKKEYFGDFLDLETISWIPLQFVDAIHTSLERHEHVLPSTRNPAELALSTSQLSPRDRNSNKSNPASGGRSDNQGKVKSMLRQAPLISETAIFLYFQKRTQCGATTDEYAHVFQLDLFRRLPVSRRKANLANLRTQHLAPWEGVVFDEKSLKNSGNGETSNPVRELIKSVLNKFGQNPCVHMIAGIVELELFNVSVAYIYFTEALALIAKNAEVPGVAGSSSSQSTLAYKWQQRVADRVRLYCLIWRSMASRIKIEMEKAVEDLNTAAAIKLDEQEPGNVDDPLLLVQRTLIMLLNGHLKSAFKLLRQLVHAIRLTKRKRQEMNPRRTASDYSNWVLISDMFGNAGLNTFSLLPLRLEKSLSRLSNPAQPLGNSEPADINKPGARDTDSGDDELRALREEEESAAAIVRNALSKKTAPGGRTVTGSSVLQTETLDKFFESGLIKLSSSGSIVQMTPFFQAILSIDENYLPPTNFASLELLKCKEVENMEEKLYMCFIRLGKRSKWLHKKIRWKFEAFIDANLAHAYLPSDLDTLLHRARLLQDQANYVSAIKDLSGCLELLSSQITWEKSKKKGSAKMKAVFANEMKRTQWLQLLLERGRLEMALANWERAIQDMTVVIEQAGKSSQTIEASAYEARSFSLIQLNRLGHAIQDLQHMLSKKEKKIALSGGGKDIQEASDERENEDTLLNYILVGNLYCQLALDQMKVSANVSQKSAALTSSILEQLKTTHLNMGFITKADEHYAKALEVSPDHFLVYYFRGRMFALSAQPKKATECLSDCLRRHPMFLPALFLRGCIYAQQSLAILALADFYRVRHRAPTYPSLHTTIGFCHFDCGNMTKAVEALTEAIQQDSSDVDAFYIRGCALQELFVLENAVKDFTRVLVINSDHLQALYQRSVCYVLFHRYREALDDLDRALRLQTEWKEAWNLHAYACFCQGRFEDAVLSYGRATGTRDVTSQDSRRLMSGRRDSQLFLHRALANMCAGHYSTALLDLDLALKRDSENYLGFVAKAFILIKVGEREKAMQLLLHTLPHYKKMQLMNPCDVIDSERMKALAKKHNHDERSPSFDVKSFGTGGFPPGLDSQSPGKAEPSHSEMKHPKIAASPDVIFSDRRVAREEQEQRAQAYRECRPTAGLPSAQRPEAEGFAHQQQKLPDSFSLASHRRTLVSTSLAASMDPAASVVAAAIDPNSPEMLRRARKMKFMRAIKKLSFEHRVLKALESVTSAKYKKNEQMSCVLSDLLRAKSSVPWPKGTLTSNILVWAFNTLGTYHLRKGKMEEALMAFSLAIQAHPYNPMTFFNRGNVFLHTDGLNSAVSGYQDAIEADEGCFQAHNNVGVAFFHLKRLEDAHDAFATGLHHVEDRKQKAILLYNLGVLFQTMDKHDEAMEFYQQAIALDGSRTEFYNNRSSILHQQLKFTVALEDYNRALALGSGVDDDANNDSSSVGNRSCIEARLNRAQLFITLGSCTSAIADLKVALNALVSAREGESKRSGTGASVDRGGAVSMGSETRQAIKAVRTAAADEALAEELLAFCEKWKDAIRIAVNDYLFGLDAFPLFSKFELYSFFGPQLRATKSTLLSTGDGVLEEERSESLMCPLPIADSSFFEFERELADWSASDECNDNHHEQDALSNSQDEVVQACKGQLVQQPVGAYLREAMRLCQTGELEDASRCLLRAHYKTALDSPEEYFLVVWRVQVILKLGSQSPSVHRGNGLSRAVILLEEFLVERQRPDEAQHDTDEVVNPSIQTKTKKPLLRSSTVSEDDDTEELSAEEISWRQQRRVIRADVYTFLGQLQQLNGQEQKARRSFAHALRLRDDHVIALLNFLQLSIVETEYEAALECVIRVFELAFSRTNTNDNSSKSTNAIATPSSADPRGILGASRTLEVMLPGMTPLRNDKEWAQVGTRMLHLLKDYKTLLSAHIQSSTPHIFRKQGALAHLVEDIRQLQTRRDAEAKASECPDTPAVSLPLALDLDAFNRILEEYTASVLREQTDVGTGSEPSAASNQDELKASFLAELTQVCDQITRSLPPEALPSKQPRRPPPVDVDIDTVEPTSQSATRKSPLGNTTAPKSPRSPNSASSRKPTVLDAGSRRPTVVPLSARSHRRTTAASNSTNSLRDSAAAPTGPSSAIATADTAATKAPDPSALKTVRDVGSPRCPLQPQRPVSGPALLQVRSCRRTTQLLTG